MQETLQETAPKQAKKTREPDWVGVQYFAYKEGFRDLSPGFPPLGSRAFAIRKNSGEDVFFEKIIFRRIATLDCDRALLQELRKEHKLLEDYLEKGVIQIYEPKQNAPISSKGLLISFPENVAIQIIEASPIDPPYAPIALWSKGESRSSVLAAIEQKRQEISGQ